MQELGAVIIIRELETILKQLVLDKGQASGSVGESSGMQTSTLETPKCDYGTSDDDTAMKNTDKDASSENNLHLVEGGKKDNALRRYELLVESGLAESLIEACIGNACELLQSNFGREVIYEVVTGGTGVLGQKFSDKLDNLHEAIASLGALPRSEESEEEHIFENFHSSRTIRKLVLDCPAFAATLWKAALKGKAEIWAQGHSSKVVSAFLESSDSEVRDLAKTELQGLVDSGALKVAETRHLKKED
ncbi:hypothetical protein Taro_035894 [Colocasia esculenta]|uniref:CPL domain-containing protein n=1 Tax=Colocasia esculenta TaxID=4460 RepID=A0A843WEM4_COLES|nr:hypothetical protein [Colocasia esculenta]